MLSTCFWRRRRGRAEKEAPQENSESANSSNGQQNVNAQSSTSDPAGVSNDLLGDEVFPFLVKLPSGLDEREWLATNSNLEIIYLTTFLNCFLIIYQLFHFLTTPAFYTLLSPSSVVRHPVQSCAWHQTGLCTGLTIRARKRNVLPPNMAILPCLSFKNKLTTNPYFQQSEAFHFQLTSKAFCGKCIAFCFKFSHMPIQFTSANWARPIWDHKQRVSSNTWS